MVLGCTHYPALKATIGRVAGPDIKLVDSAETTAEGVESATRKHEPAAARRRRSINSLPPMRRNGLNVSGRFSWASKIDPAAIELVDLQ